MHAAAHDYVRAALAGRTPKQVIEIGSRDVNGTIRDLLPADAAYTGIDITDGPNVDIVADAATWKPLIREVTRFGDPELTFEGPFDLVLCLEVLEHTPDWQAIVDNAATWLKRKGLLVITAACPPRAPHSAIDGGPTRPGEHYRNVDPDELRSVLEAHGEVSIEVDRDAGDVRATLTVR